MSGNIVRGFVKDRQREVLFHYDIEKKTMDISKTKEDILELDLSNIYKQRDNSELDDYSKYIHLIFD